MRQVAIDGAEVPGGEAGEEVAHGVAGAGEEVGQLGGVDIAAAGRGPVEQQADQRHPHRPGWVGGWGCGGGGRSGPFDGEILLEQREVVAGGLAMRVEQQRLFQAAQSRFAVAAEGVEHGQVVVQQCLEGRLAGGLADDAVEAAGLAALAASGQLPGAAVDLAQTLDTHFGGVGLGGFRLGQLVSLTPGHARG